MRRRGQLMFVTTALITGLSLAAAWFVLPAQNIPIHWAEGNTPDGFADRGPFLLGLAVLAIGLSGFLIVIGHLVARSPELRGLNVPNRSEWADPRFHAEAGRRLRDALAGLAGMTLLLVAALPWVSYAALDEPKGGLPWLFPAAVLVYVGGVLVWVVLFLRMFETPAASPSETTTSAK